MRCVACVEQILNSSVPQTFCTLQRSTLVETIFIWLTWPHMALLLYTTLQILPVLFRAYHTDCSFFGHSIMASVGTFTGCCFGQGAEYRRFFPGRVLQIWASLREPPTPNLSALNSHSCDGFLMTANLCILHPTTE